MKVEGQVNPELNHKRITFGSYYMVNTGTKNDIKRRSVPSISLNESNDHGGHYFMSLYTGKRLHRYQWTEPPIDDDAISQIRYLSEGYDAEKMIYNYPMFE